MKFGKFLALLILGLIGVIVAVNILGHAVGFLLGLVLKIALPVALLVGVVYLIYRVSDKKAIGGDRTGLLP